MDILFDLYQRPDGEGIQWPPFNHILLKRIIEAGLIEIREPSAGVSLGGMRASPDGLFLTHKGRAFLDEIGAHEL